MTHPIDPLTPNAVTARYLWNLARVDDALHFIDEWERMMTDHEKELEYAHNEIPDRSSRAWDDVFMEGERQGYDMGHDDGYKEGYQDAMREVQEKVRIITGEQLNLNS